MSRANHRILLCFERARFAIKTILRGLALAASFCLIASSTGWADEQTVRLTPGAGASLMLERPFELVLIDNPQVVGVHDQIDRAVILEGRALGTSNVVFVDAQDVTIANIKVLVCETVPVRTAFHAEASCD
jgi:Flp pilus assembly secretin CpaC